MEQVTMPCEAKENHNHNGKTLQKWIRVAWFFIAIGLSCIICGIFWKSRATEEEKTAIEARDKSSKLMLGYLNGPMSRHDDNNYCCGLYSIPGYNHGGNGYTTKTMNTIVPSEDYGHIYVIWMSHM